MRYTIKLGVNKRAEFDAPSIGSFIHGCLENFFTSLREAGVSPETLDKAERERLTRSAAEKYLFAMGEDVKATQTAVKIKRLTRAAIPIIDSLCDEFEKTKFRPRFFELKIDGGDAASPDPIKFTSEDGGSVYVYGIIDRVDTCESEGNLFVRVMDYKTGNKEFTPDDMENGRNLQMFLYLKAIIESDKKKFRERLGVSDNGKIVPAGVIYIKTSLADAVIDRNLDELALKAVKDNQEREGMILCGEENAALMGEEYIPHANKKDKESYLYSEEDFEKIMQTVEDSVLDIADKIKSGSATATPNIDGKYSACDWCEFKPICRNVKTAKK